MSDTPSLYGRFFGRSRRRIAQLERDVAKRDQALRTVRYHARQVELKTASFGGERLFDSRLREIEVHALDARLVAERLIGGPS